MRSFGLKTTLAGLTLCAGILHAQEPARRTTYGILGGVSIATISKLDGTTVEGFGVDFKTKKRIGAELGAFANFPLGSVMSFQPELHYTQKGISMDLGEGLLGEGNATTGSIKLGYIELPLLLRLEVPTSGSGLRPFVVLGPSLNFRSSCKIAADGGGFNITSDCDGGASAFGNDESDDPFSKTDFGGVLGGGLQMSMMGLPFSLQARYQLGFSKLVKDSEVTPASGGTSSSVSDAKNRNFSILLGFAF